MLLKAREVRAEATPAVPAADLELLAGCRAIGCGASALSLCAEVADWR
jgi:hypothetical protein